ncbi:MAG: D-alanine--D-alanine ligase [Elusimicrobia bacterium]|nr:D-alanine--D-alanine ligase [Elusimicrobiota bacterium]
MKKLKIGVIFGGSSVEHEVSIDSAKTVCSSLRAGKHEIFPIYVDRKGGWHLVRFKDFTAESEGGSEITLSPGRGNFIVRKRSLRLDAAFPVIHGTAGEDGTLQGLLEIMRIPYVGCGVAASALGMDKILTKKIVQLEGLPVLKHVVVDSSNISGRQWVSDSVKMGFPLFVKPVALGSSVGVTKVKRPSELERAVMQALKYDSKAIVEKGVDKAREIVCGILGTEFKARSSVCGEVAPGGLHEFYDYNAKYIDEHGFDFTLPARLSGSVSDKIRKTAEAIFKLAGCSGMARVDFLVNPDREKEFYFCEINTIPGFTSHSLYPRLWEATGLQISSLADELVRLALERHKDKQKIRLIGK